MVKDAMTIPLMATGHSKFHYGRPVEWPEWTGGNDEIGVFVRISQVNAIDISQQRCTVSGHLILFWRSDMAMQKLSEKEDFDCILQDMDEEPQPQWTNAEELSITRKFTYALPSRKHFITEFQFKGTFTDPVDAQNFPFDWQDFTIELGLSPMNAACLASCYTIHMAPIIFMHNQAIPEWKIFGKGEAPGYSAMHGGHIRTMFCKSNGEQGHQARVWCRFYARRFPQYYLYNLVSMVAMISALSVCSFSIECTQIAERLSFNVSLLLTEVAMKFVLDGKVPKVPYRTMMDIRLSMSSALLICVLAIQSVEVYFFGANQDVDDWVACVYTFVMVLVESLYALRAFFLINSVPDDDWEDGQRMKPVH